MQEIIQRLKQQHGKLYATIIGDDLYVWRPLRRGEYRHLLEDSASEHETQERICQATVVWPEDIDFSSGAAGVPGALAPEIKEQSGYGSPEKSYELFHTHRAQMEHFEFQAEAAIAATFPRISFDDMQSWTVDELMWHATRAEWAMKHVYGRPIEWRIGAAEGEEPTEPVEPKTKQEEARELREAGIDPMNTLDPTTLRPPVAPFPAIGGTKWQSEEFWNVVPQQVSRLSERREGRREE